MNGSGAGMMEWDILYKDRFSGCKYYLL